MERKEILEKASQILGFEIDGVMCVTQKMAIDMVGITRPTFVKKVKRLGLKYRRSDNGRVYFERNVILDAIQRGLFERYI